MFDSVFTEDLLGTVKHKYQISLSDEDISKVAALQNDFTEILARDHLQCQCRSTVAILKEAETRDVIMRYLTEANGLVLCPDDTFGKDVKLPHVFHLDIARWIQGFEEFRFHFGPRPPYPPADVQFRNAQQWLSQLSATHERVTVFELGTMGGRFLDYLITTASQYGINIGKVVTCVMRPIAQERLRKKFSHLEFENLILTYEHCWDESRDVASAHGYQPDPLYVWYFNGGDDKLLTFIPYVETMPRICLKLKDEDKFWHFGIEFRKKLNSILYKYGKEIAVVGFMEQSYVFGLAPYTEE